MAGLLAPFGGIIRIRFKGSPVNLPDSQPTRLPRIICFQNKTGSLQVNARKNCSGVCTKRRILERRLAQAPLQLWLAAPCSLLFSLPLGCRLFHIGVENGLPSALCHFPNRSGIEGAGGIFSIIGPFDNDLVGAHDGISS